MTTPARIAAFLATSAPCLGLVYAPAGASPRDGGGLRQARAPMHDREPAAGQAAAEVARPAEAAARSHQDVRER